MDYEQWEFLEPQIVTTIRFSNLNNDPSFEEELGSIQPTKASSDRACAVAGDPNTSFQGDEKEKTRLKRHKAKGKPNSIDLTFHLLREYLQMAKEEKMAQKAFNNKKLMQAIGK
uniref:Corticotropin-releasing factor domain-containing protein n=1 Tax=Anguilla anguilla TaxID=7936 RepID=A0A0E9PQL1_ANGAN